MDFVILPDGGFALDALLAWSAAGATTVNFSLRHGAETFRDTSGCSVDVFVAAVRLAREQRDGRLRYAPLSANHSPTRPGIKDEERR